MTTMVATKKHVNDGAKQVNDMNVIYSRKTGTQNSGCDIDKICPIVRSGPSTNIYVLPHRRMRSATSKSSLKQQLQVERTVSETTVVVIDGSALFWGTP